MMRRRGPGLIRTAARTAVIAGTATAVSGRVAHRQQQRYMDEATQQQGGYPQQQQTSYYEQQPTASEAPDYMAELERLAQLKQQGIITNDEFEAKKRQLLGI